MGSGNVWYARSRTIAFKHHQPLLLSSPRYTYSLDLFPFCANHVRSFIYKKKWANILKRRMIKLGPSGRNNQTDPPSFWSLLTNPRLCMNPRHFDLKGHHEISQILLTEGDLGITSIQFQYVEDSKYVLSDEYGLQSNRDQFHTVRSHAMIFICLYLLFFFNINFDITVCRLSWTIRLSTFVESVVYITLLAILIISNSSHSPPTSRSTVPSV